MTNATRITRTPSAWLRYCIRYCILGSISLILCSCSLLAYRPTVKQGQYITAQQNAQLRKGMSVQQVTNLLGTPIYGNPLQNHTLIYVYTIKPGRRRQQQLILYFKHQKLYRRDFRPLA